MVRYASLVYFYNGSCLTDIQRFLTLSLTAFNTLVRQTNTMLCTRLEEK